MRWFLLVGFALLWELGHPFCVSAGNIVLTPTGFYAGYTTGYHAYGPIAIGDAIPGHYWTSGNTGFIDYPLAYAVFDVSSYNLNSLESMRLDVSVTSTLLMPPGSGGQVHFAATTINSERSDYVLEGPYSPWTEGEVSQTDTTYWYFDQTTNSTAPGYDSFGGGFAQLPNASGIVEFQLGNATQGAGLVSGSISGTSVYLTVHAATLTLTELAIPEPSSFVILAEGVFVLLFGWYCGGWWQERHGLDRR